MTTNLVNIFPLQLVSFLCNSISFLNLSMLLLAETFLDWEHSQEQVLFSSKWRQSSAQQKEY